jgi:guanylate kinase
MKRKLLGNLKEGILFILSAPAGTGKTTLVRMLAEEFPCITPSISYTTRKPRPDEIDKISYHFISEKKFEKKIEEDEFLEYVRLYGHYYGTSKKWVSERLSQGKHVILVIDTQGALQIKEKVKARSIFLLPPSLEELQRRLEERKTESDVVIQERLLTAQGELRHASWYDYQMINDDLSTAYQILRSILIAEEHRCIIDLST